MYHLPDYFICSTGFQKFSVQLQKYRMRDGGDAIEETMTGTFHFMEPPKKCTKGSN
jgi:hypothetical protein